jgi:hypothetical protein
MEKQNMFQTTKQLVYQFTIWRYLKNSLAKHCEIGTSSNLFQEFSLQVRKQAGWKALVGILDMKYNKLTHFGEVLVLNHNHW